MPLPSYLRAHPDGVFLHVKLQPRAREDAIGAALGDELKIKVMAPPVDAAANEALVHLLADRLHCPKSSVQLIRGQTSRHKVVWLPGLQADRVASQLS